MNYIFSLLILVTYFIHSVWKLKKQLHILQLNSYMNERYAKWLGQHYKQTSSRKELLPGIAFLPLLFNWLVPAAVIWSVSYLFLFFTRGTPQVKKPLVFTQRVTRLFVVMLLLLVGLCILAFQGLEAANNFVILFNLAFLLLFNSFSFLIALTANFLVIPLEKAINSWYYKDAQKRIQAMPRLRVIGITGSFGKTSTKTILQQMLAQQFHVLMTPESYNTPMGITRVIRSSLTPVHEAFIAEMGAKQQGDIKELCRLVSPKFGILTAIGEQHLETFGSLDNIKSTKHELIQSLPQDGIAFLNMDNEHIRELVPLTQVRKVFFGVNSADLHYFAKNIRMSSAGCSFDFCVHDGQQLSFHTKLLGKHNIYNILGAAALACELGINLKILAGVVRSLAPIPHRLELKKTSQNITIIDDAFNSNPVGAHSALEVLNVIEGKQKILISPGMIELGTREYELNKAFGSHAAEICDEIILVGWQQTLPMQEAFKESYYLHYYVAKDLREANQHLRSIAQSGDVVLYENDLPDTYNE